MTSLVFVHGTGVRERQYEATFERIRRGVASCRPDVDVVPCRWGSGLGAALRADGASIPDYAATRRVTDDFAAEQAWASARWRLLDADPLHELRMIAALATGPSDADGSGRAFRIGERARGLAAHPETSRLFADLDLSAQFRAATAAVAGSAAMTEALHDSAAAELPGAIARAMFAQTLRQAASDGLGPVPVLPSQRDRVLLAMTEALGGATLGWATSMAKTTAMLAWRWSGAGVTERRRGAIMDVTSPVAGDILVYLSRGERIRRFIADCCRDARPPIVLLGHSLGGIACLDLLATTRLPDVTGLITVGSQGPLLYEIDALPSIAYGEPLPPSVPAWTNIYDPRDLLAHVGAGLFPGRVVDVAVESGNPFPFAHSDYFGNPDFYTCLARILP